MDGDDILTKFFDKLFDYDKKTSVVTQLKPYAFFYRWVGIFPIQFSNGLARNSFFFFFWPFALFGTIYSGIVDDLAVFQIETKRRILFPVITTVVCMITSKNFAPLIANIQRYDEEFSTNLWITKRHRRLKGGRFVWMLWIPINIWVQVMIDCGSRDLNWKEHLLEPKVLARSIGESLPFTILTFYLLYCNELKLRFLDLNESFVSFLESSYKYSPEDFLQRSFEKYRLMHFRLTDECVRLANAAFGAPLICCYLWTAVSSISIIYWCASGQTSNVLSTELIMVVNCGYMYMVPVLSDGLTKASSGLVTDLFMLPIAELKMKTKLQITIFVYEVTLNQSVMSACGYFDLRKSFISTWFGLIVSCLIIVLQRTKIALSAAAAAAAAAAALSSTPSPS